MSVNRALLERSYTHSPNPLPVGTGSPCDRETNQEAEERTLAGPARGGAAPYQAFQGGLQLRAQRLQLPAASRVLLLCRLVGSQAAALEFCPVSAPGPGGKVGTEHTP